MGKSIVTVTKEVYMKTDEGFDDYIDVEIDFDADEIMDMADDLEMIVFRDMDEVQEMADETLDLYDLLEVLIKKAKTSPYDKMRLMDALKGSGIL